MDVNKQREEKHLSSMPLAYLISFRCYGTWLHGDIRGSVHRHHNLWGTPFLEPSEPLEAAERQNLRHPPTTLNEEQRTMIEQTIREVCQYRGWNLYVLTVRTNHVHVVVSANAEPECVLNDFKVWSTRRLRESGLCPSDIRLWSRHGSTRYLWDQGSLEAACRYVIEGQGEEF